MLKKMPNYLKKIIHTITFVDISYSWGPAIHYVELWNEFALLNSHNLI